MSEYNLPDALLISNSDQVFTQVKELLLHNKHLQLNLGNITNIDSAGIATLIAIKEYARNGNYQIKFLEATSAIQNLCQLYKIVL